MNGHLISPYHNAALADEIDFRDLFRPPVDSTQTCLRDQARIEGDAMANSFHEARAAYLSGDGALASTLSKEGRCHQARMKALNRQAADETFEENNAHQPAGAIDLHGLTVGEAIKRTESFIRDARQGGHSEICVITGRGLHSPTQVAKIRPAIVKLVK
ncbi:unnamed protein product, partial [Tilletia controversa]